jgi:hypothetical protein
LFACADGKFIAMDKRKTVNKTHMPTFLSISILSSPVFERRVLSQSAI